MRSPDGSKPHSTDPADYAPMCRSCHRLFDIEHDPVFAEAIRSSLAAQHERTKSDPALVAQLSASRRATASKRYRCGECSMTSTATGIGIHQKSSRHTGRENI